MLEWRIFGICVEDIPLDLLALSIANSFKKLKKAWENVSFIAECCKTPYHKRDFITESYIHAYAMMIGQRSTFINTAVVCIS